MTMEKGEGADYWRFLICPFLFSQQITPACKLPRSFKHHGILTFKPIDLLASHCLLTLQIRQSDFLLSRDLSNNCVDILSFSTLHCTCSFKSVFVSFGRYWRGRYISSPATFNKGLGILLYVKSSNTEMEKDLLWIWLNK